MLKRAKGRRGTKGFAKEVTLRYFSYYLLYLLQNIVIFSILNSLDPTPSLLCFLENIGLVVSKDASR